MDTENEPIVHPSWPAPGEHLFGPWYAKDKRHQYRVCVHPQCKAVETQEVKG